MRTQQTFEASRPPRSRVRRIVITLSGMMLALTVGIVFGQVFRPDFRLSLFMPETGPGISEESLTGQAPASGNNSGGIWFDWLDQNQVPEGSPPADPLPESPEPDPGVATPAPPRAVGPEYVPMPPAPVRYPSESGDILGAPLPRAPDTPPTPEAAPSAPAPNPAPDPAFAPGFKQ